IVNFGADLLGSYYTAKQTQNSILSLPSVQSNVSLSSRNSAAATPWDQDQLLEAERSEGFQTTNSKYRLLTSDYQKIQNLDEFINRKSPIVRSSDLNDDSKGLFVLYNALKDLKTIAEYAGDPRTSDTKLTILGTQFKMGLAQVKDFINEEDFEKLTLLFGEKSSGLTARAGLGKRQFDFVGPVIHNGERDDPITTLSGGETFTINLTRKTTNNGVDTQTDEIINITVPSVEEDRTIGNLTAYINAQIQQVKTTDDDGEEVPLYQTKFFVEEVEKNKFAFRIKTDFRETMTFSAPDVEPAVYITGNSVSVDAATKIQNDGVPKTGFITKLTDLDSADATKEFHLAVFGNASEALLEPQKTVLTSVVDPLQYASETSSNAIASDSKGNVYVVGSTQGRFANHLNTSENGDAFLNKYDASGKMLWSRLIGSQGEGTSFALTVDTDDNIIIAGQADKITAGVSNDPNATNTDIFNGQDSFVTKFDNVGTQQWLYQHDKYGTDGVDAVTTDANGDIFITGRQNSIELSSTITGGTDSAYVMKINGSSGLQEDYIELGSSTADLGQGIAVASDGNIIVASKENDNFILQKLDATDLSSALWTYDFGSLSTKGEIGDIVVDGSRVYISGSASNSLSGAGTQVDAPHGGLDSFVMAIDDLGNSASADWTKFIGSSAEDRNGGLTVVNGKIYTSGTVSGDIAGGTLQGDTDSFATKIDATTGATDWVKQIGYSTENRSSTGIAFADQGSSVLTKLGLPIGGFEDVEKKLIETQTTARAGDYFFIKVNDKITKKIEIKAGDTYRTLSNRINSASYRYLKSSVTFSTGSSISKETNEEEEFDAKAVIAEKLKQIKNERNGITEPEDFKRAGLDISGNNLKIATKDGGIVEIIAGRGEKDALKKLGLEPSLVLSSEELFNLNKDEEDDILSKIGGVFAFKMDERFNVFDKRDARYVAQELNFAISVVQSAFRSLTYDPVAEKIKQDALKQTNGPVPPQLQKQLANYSDGLRRISSLVPGGGGIIT
ncbi:MAG: SBBP repeat-containing protein, partial [Emcibacteraceae bacterium]|nr:SBBP repeat-containing protein [Emcibacteraceae bacterium]